MISVFFISTHRLLSRRSKRFLAGFLDTLKELGSCVNSRYGTSPVSYLRNQTYRHLPITVSQECLATKHLTPAEQRGETRRPLTGSTSLPSLSPLTPKQHSLGQFHLYFCLTHVCLCLGLYFTDSKTISHTQLDSTDITHVDLPNNTNKRGLLLLPKLQLKIIQIFLLHPNFGSFRISRCIRLCLNLPCI